jgi:hypothetical protein
LTTEEKLKAMKGPLDGFLSATDKLAYYSEDGIRSQNNSYSTPLLPVAIGSNIIIQEAPEAIGNELPAGMQSSTTSGISEQADAATVSRLYQGFSDQTHKLATENPDAFNAISQQAFGNKGKELCGIAQRNDLPQPANIRFVDRATLLGSDGAYSPDNDGTVYLAKDLMNQPEMLQQVYNEEAAHHIDNVLGGPDSKGDEGEIFAGGLNKGRTLDAQEYEAASGQNDMTTINVDGKQLEVENRLSALDIFNLATSAASWIPGAGDAVALASAAVNAAAGNYVGALMDIISLVPGVGDAIGTAGKLLIQNRLGREAAGELLKGLERYGPKLKSGIQDALNSAKQRGIISAKQHRDLSTTLQKQLDEVTTQARKAAGNPKADIDDGVVRSPDVVATLQRPSNQVTVSPYKGKHAPRSGQSDRDVAASTKNGPAKFYNGVNMDELQRQAWDQGTPVTNGKPWKVFDAGPKDIGAKNGQSTRFMRVESTPDGVIHGHPITSAEYQALGGR